MEKKHFKQWIDLKARLHFGNSSPKISEGDIWWCGCGENVGVEIILTLRSLRKGNSQLFAKQE